MTASAILIAALSGRALAASARRAGYDPSVADSFGDEDTAQLCRDLAVLPDAIRTGFRKVALMEALDQLAGTGEREVADLVVGAGFEDCPALVEAIEKRFNLLGCSASAIRACKDPDQFFGLLAELGILHPDTVLERPGEPEGWLSKRIGASGGRHIRRLSKKGSPRPGRYYQRELSGVSLSATAIASARGTAFAFTQSWCSPTKREPFRYGGTVSVDQMDADLEARLIDTCLSLIKPLQLVGLVSFDFLIDEGGEAFLIEVNPRPGASLDVLDDQSGTLFKAHLAACRGEDSTDVLAKTWRPSAKACAYLYADDGALSVGDIDWPEWVSDRPRNGQKIAAGGPIATVHANGQIAADAARNCHQRLTKLKAVL
ncbi:MAG: ATP-grasp domain-containing protein [Alphaproteobacteria bacterium]|nr:ATP-grasp domain-containing protein [Alphaproteobacteria bacterium]